jgi:hypothetical protein
MHLLIAVYEEPLDTMDEYCPECSRRYDRPTIEYLKSYGMI